MGYLGLNAFENDQAADWLAGLRGKVTLAKLSKPLDRYLEFAVKGPGEDETFSRAQMDRVIEAVLAFWRQYPPSNWRDEASTLEEWLRQEEARKREFYYSGQYLETEYGPVEEALAAAELVAVLSMKQLISLPEETASLVKANADVCPSKNLVRKAIETVDHVFRNDKYRRMRKTFLDAFPNITHGDDEMAAVRDLLDRLRSLDGK